MKLLKLSKVWSGNKEKLGEIEARATTINRQLNVFRLQLAEKTKLMKIMMIIAMVAFYFFYPSPLAVKRETNGLTDQGLSS